MIEISDNEGAEVLARHVALAVTEDAVVRGRRPGGHAQTLADLGVPLAGVVLRDGSGLVPRQPADRRRPWSARCRPPRTRTGPDLRAAADRAAGRRLHRARWRPASTPAPGPGSAGSAPRPARLTGVRALAGVATDQAGTPMAFVLSADRIRYARTVEAEQDLDELAAGLGACRCSR